MAYLGVPSALDPEPREPFSHNGFLVCEQPHPEHGLRVDPDEMLTIYAGPEVRLPPVADLEEPVREALAACGEIWQASGFSVQEAPAGTQRYAVNGATVVVEPLLDAASVAKYGPGLMLRTQILQPQPTIANEILNAANTVIADCVAPSHANLGPVVWDPDIGVHTRSLLDAAVLAGSRHSDLVGVLTSAVGFAAATRMLLLPSDS